MKNEKWDDVHGNTTPDDRMVAFLESPTDSYAILQLREDVDDNIPLMFANYSYLQKKEMEPEIDRYEVVYHGSISMSEDVNRQLEDLYVKFNIDHPDDFRGHSMSVSDIVALKVVGEVSFHYVDSVGFQKLENFMKSENYLKNAEMAMERTPSFRIMPRWTDGRMPKSWTLSLSLSSPSPPEKSHLFLR